jgi:hypothetical protein
VFQSRGPASEIDLDKSSENPFGARFDIDPAGKDFSPSGKGSFASGKVFPFPESLLVGVSRLFPGPIAYRVSLKPSNSDLQG